MELAHPREIATGGRALDLHYPLDQNQYHNQVDNAMTAYLFREGVLFPEIALPFSEPLKVNLRLISAQLEISCSSFY